MRRFGLGFLVVVGIAPAVGLGQTPAPPKLDRHGEPLPDGAIARLGVLSFRTEGRPVRAGFLHDGKQIVVSIQNSKGTALQLFDRATGKVTRTLPLKHHFTTFALSPVAPWAAVVDQGGVEIWDLAEGKRVRQFPTDGLTVYVLAFSPDGKVLAAGGNASRQDAVALAKHRHPIRRWDVATGKELPRLEGHNTTVIELGFAADGKRLLSASGDYSIQDKSGLHKYPGAIHAWDLATGKRLHDHANSNSYVAFSPDGRFFARALAADKGAEVIETATGRRVTGIDIRYASVCFSANGQRVAAAGDGQPIRIWDTSSGQELAPFRAPLQGRVTAFSPDGLVILSCGEEGWMREAGWLQKWDIAGRCEDLAVSVHETGIHAVAASPVGRRIATASRRTVFLWNAESGEELKRWDDHAGNVHHLAFSSDGAYLASGADDGSIIVRDATPGANLGAVRRRFKANDRIAALTFTPDGALVSVSGDQIVQVWDVKRGSEQSKATLPVPPGATPTLAPNGSIVAMLPPMANRWEGAHGMVSLWAVPSGRLLRQLDLGARRLGDDTPFRGEQTVVWDVAFSPDSRFLAVSDSLETFGLRRVLSQHTIRVVEAATGKPIYKIAGHTVGVRLMAFSPDGTKLAHGTGRARGWGQGGESAVAITDVGAYRDGQLFATPPGDDDAAKTAKPRTMEGHLGMPTCVTFLAQSRHVATGSSDQTVLVWPVAPFVNPVISFKDGVDAGNLDADALWQPEFVDDPAKAYRLLAELAQRGDAVLPAVRKQLRPVPRVADAHIAKLIAALDDKNFAVRNRATAELEQLEERAKHALRAALPDAKTLEMRRRLEALLGRLDSPSPQTTAHLRGVLLLQRVGTPAAQELLRELAAGAPEARLTVEAQAALRVAPHR